MEKRVIEKQTKWQNINNTKVCFRPVTMTNNIVVYWIYSKKLHSAVYTLHWQSTWSSQYAHSISPATRASLAEMELQRVACGTFPVVTRTTFMFRRRLTQQLLRKVLVITALWPCWAAADENRSCNNNKKKKRVQTAKLEPWTITGSAN